MTEEISRAREAGAMRTVSAVLMMRKLAAYLRQNQVARALAPSVLQS